jgi:hypothetical protein
VPSEGKEVSLVDSVLNAVTQATSTGVSSMMGAMDAGKASLARGLEALEQGTRRLVPVEQVT